MFWNQPREVSQRTENPATEAGILVNEEYPMTMECTLRAYDEDNCYMYGKIVNVSVDESVLTDGKPDPAKLQPIAFDQVNSKYLVVKDVVGNAFADGFALQK